jgi:hypothetical protein
LASSTWSINDKFVVTIVSVESELEDVGVESRSWLGPSMPMKQCRLKGNKTEADAASTCKRELLAKNGRRTAASSFTFYLLT